MSRRRARTNSDSAFLGNVSNQDVKAFRDYTFSPRDTLQNPTTSLDTNSVDVGEFQTFLKQPVPESSKLAPFPITQEPETAREIEPDTAATSIPQQDIKTRSTVRNGHEVLEILDSSDSEVEPEDDASGTAYNGDTSDYVNELDELLVPSLTLSSCLLPARSNSSLCVERGEKDADSETVTEPATRLITNGTAPVSPALQSHRFLYQECRQESLLGLGIEALMGLVRVDTEQPLAEHGVHTVMMSPSGGTLVYSGYSYLLNFVHGAFASGLRVDATFRRVRGELKEWEIVIWYAPAARAVTIARIYTNKATGHLSY
ncbi:hypothetical protein BDZ89DRAFT_720088 [Hymenopellis radicata]|nr:hypothetical protein BDZ89DRAFT_720088 [Hymenopellis radicata]